MLVLVKNGQTSALRNYREAVIHLKLIADDPAVRSKQEQVLNDFATYVSCFICFTGIPIRLKVTAHLFHLTYIKLYL